MDSSSSSSSNWEDVILVVMAKGTAHFRVNKSVLVSGSPVFKALFEQDCATKWGGFFKKSKQNRLDIPELDKDVFVAMLQYLYFQSVSQVTLDTMADRLLIVADKYQIESLKNICEKQLVSKISNSNVIDLLILSEQTNTPQLKSSCIAFVNSNSNEDIQTGQWIQQLIVTANTKLIGELYMGLASTKNVNNNQKQTRRVRKNKRKSASSDYNKKHAFCKSLQCWCEKPIFFYIYGGMMLLMNYISKIIFGNSHTSTWNAILSVIGYFTIAVGIFSELHRRIFVQTHH